MHGRQQCHSVCNQAVTSRGNQHDEGVSRRLPLKGIFYQYPLDGDRLDEGTTSFTEHVTSATVYKLGELSQGWPCDIGQGV